MLDSPLVATKESWKLLFQQFETACKLLKEEFDSETALQNSAAGTFLMLLCAFVGKPDDLKDKGTALAANCAFLKQSIQLAILQVELCIKYLKSVYDIQDL